MTSPIVAVSAIAVAAALAEAAVLLWVLRRPPAAWVTSNYRGLVVVGRAGATLLAPLFLVSQIGLVWAGSLGIAETPASLVGMGVAFALRLASIYGNLRVPAFHLGGE